MLYFRLLAGSHQGPSPDNKMYDAGDIVPSRKDLEQLFGANKFRRIPNEEAEKLLAQQQQKRKPSFPLFSNG